MIIRRATIVLIGIAIGCGHDDECETNRDCPSGRYQCIARQCVLPAGPDLGFRETTDVGFAPPGPDLGRRDFGFPDLGFRDLGFRDLGFRDADPEDAGFPRDAEPEDTDNPGDDDSGVDADLGFADAMPADAADTGAPDAGLPGPPTDTEARVEVALVQVASSQTDPVAEARIVDYTGSGRMLTVTQRDGCTIRERGIGSPTGLAATRIELRNGNTAIDLVPGTGVGIFENNGTTQPQQLFGTGMIGFQIVSSGASGTLAAATAAVGPPTGPLLPTTPPQTPIAFASVQLAAFATQGVNRFEAYDAPRTVEVICPVTLASTGLPLWLPSYYSAGASISLDLRKEAEVTTDVSVIGRGPVPVTFRAARTVRYTVLLP